MSQLSAEFLNPRVTVGCSVFWGKKSVPEVALGGQNTTFSLHLVVCGLEVFKFLFF